MRSVSPIAALLVVLGLLGPVLAGCNDACDGDGDGFCAPEDCDDADPLVHPDASERCNGFDDNCNGGLSAEERDDFDADGTADCFDCADRDPLTFPGATELCDGEDNDCDGEVREDERDNDGDGYRGCDECNDADSSMFPGAEEVCDGEDTDCDGVLPPTETDQDGDEFIECDGDCDPNREEANPDAPEICDGQDNDCDGEQLPEELIDVDLDGTPACADCDDEDFNVNPQAEEVCDGVDNNCDGEGYLDPETADPTEKDDDEDGWLICDGDCEDEDPAINPSAFELLENGIDENCDELDNQPGWTPLADPPQMMLDSLAMECLLHYGSDPVVADFELGPGVVGTAYTGIEFSAERAGQEIDVVFGSGGGYAGDGFATTEGPVDSLTVTFDQLEDLVVFAIEIEDPAATDDHDIEIFQLGSSLIVGPTFGGTPAGAGWNYRASFSHAHLGFDEMVFLPATDGEVISLDEFSFCR